MIPSSSTSNSEPRSWQVKARIPWDWALALSLVVIANWVVGALAAWSGEGMGKEWAVIAHLRPIDERLRIYPDAPTVLVGSSLAARIPVEDLSLSLDAIRMGPVLEVSNFGANAGAVLYAIEKVVLPRTRPKWLLYAIDSQAVNENGLRRREQSIVVGTMKFLAEDRGRWWAVWWAYDHVPVYRHQFKLRTFLQRPWRSPFPVRKPREPAAGPPRPWTIADSPQNHEAERDLEFGPKGRAELRRMVELCAERGIRLVFLNMPISEEHYTFYGEDGRRRYREQYREPVSAFVTSLGAEWVDLNDGSFEHEHFLDSNHLGRAGTDKLIPMIQASLAALAK